MMFANYGEPGALSLRLCNESARHQSPADFIEAGGEAPGVNYWDAEPANRKLVLRCFHVCTFSAREDRQSLRESVGKLLTVCRKISLNIGSRRVEQHLYEWPNEAITVHAGPGSSKHFRDNMYKRLAEVFCNFSWLLAADPSHFNPDEFRAYEKLLNDLTRLEPTKALTYASRCYQDARNLIDQR